MTTSVEFYNWWIVDERTGSVRLTAYKLTRIDAGKAFPGAEPDPQTREIRNLPDPGYTPPNSRPGVRWHE